MFLSLLLHSVCVSVSHSYLRGGLHFGPFSTFSPKNFHPPLFWGEGGCLGFIWRLPKISLFEGVPNVQVLFF